MNSRALGLALVLVAGCRPPEEFRPLSSGDPAPAFTLAMLAGDTLSVRALQGRAVLLNVWATWCVPCREEMPALQRVHEALADSGLVVIGVSIDGRRAEADVARFVEEVGIGFPIALDPSGSVQDVFRTIGVPETFLIDRQGRIVRRWVGQFEPDAADSRESIATALGR
ncbi:MAG: TlpA family protein disulfide reductase [Gemmatimonadetes bacterium]|nr:TlpA family protein disulfide reductase [Gemmatimonadota bacterium]